MPIEKSEKNILRIVVVNPNNVNKARHCPFLSDLMKALGYSLLGLYVTCIVFNLEADTCPLNHKELVIRFVLVAIVSIAIWLLLLRHK
jgi:hypothetical protein